MNGTATRSEPERARRILSVGVLAFRLASFAWMLIANLLATTPLHRPALAWTAMAITGVWTLWLASSRERPDTVLWIDLALSCGLVVVSGLVVAKNGPSGRLFFATTYPASTALAWGAARGRGAGIAAGATLSVALFVNRLVSGYGLADFNAERILSLLNGAVYYLLAGGAAGVVSSALDRSATQLRVAMDDAIRAREHAARLAQHKALARAIHDSVLQALAFINKRARELGEQGAAPPSEILRLAEIAGEQEHQLRALILREPQDAPEGSASLRDALEAAAGSVSGLVLTVSATGPLWLPASDLDQLMAAVHQAVDNVVEHSAAARAAIFAEQEDGWVTVSVRDDGRGFVYNEEQLRAESKAGMLGSMKGRIEDLGGRMRVHTAPGAGTEVELRIPVRAVRA
jgi:signal transduction histidine kinase